MLAIDSSPQTSNSVFHIAKTFLGLAVFLGTFVVSRWGIRRFISDRGRTPHRSSKLYASVLEQAFGNYSVEYHLRASTNTSEGIFDSHAELRRNILVAFAEAGIEIMTPTIISRRDASELAVRTELFPGRPQPRGTRITVDNPSDEYDQMIKRRFASDLAPVIREMSDQGRSFFSPSLQ
jgi:hypothetical protein